MRGGLLTRIANAAFCWPKNRRLAACEEAEGTLLKMFVLQHAPCRLPDCFSDRNFYVPLQCGRALHPAIEGTLGDDEGENISALNADINEMTGIWWVGRHYLEIGDPDYVGFCHYRRLLSWSPDVLAEDTVLACKTISWRTLRGFFAAYHPVKALDAFVTSFASEFGAEEGRLLMRYLDGHVFYPCNCFVMSRRLFHDYSAFMGRCVQIVQALLRGAAVDRTGLDAYQRRVFGFILERMTSYWIWRENRARHIRVVGCDIRDFDIPNAANSIR